MHGLRLYRQCNGDASPSMSQLSPKSGSLSAIVRSYKSSVTRWCRQKSDRDFRWQSSFYVQYKRLGKPQATWTYEHIIRGETALNNIRRYIINNPDRWLEDTNYTP